MSRGAHAAIKAFAREVCRNDLLNFGRLHFFFPDSRLALDLNTDKTLKARIRAFEHTLTTQLSFMHLAKPEIAACVGHRIPSKTVPASIDLAMQHDPIERSSVG